MNSFVLQWSLSWNVLNIFLNTSFSNSIILFSDLSSALNKPTKKGRLIQHCSLKRSLWKLFMFWGMFCSLSASILDLFVDAFCLDFIIWRKMLYLCSLARLVCYLSNSPQPHNAHPPAPLGSRVSLTVSLAQTRSPAVDHPRVLPCRDSLSDLWLARRSP